jgi:hypothetical protein
LGLGVCDDASGLRLRLLYELSADPLRFLAGLFANRAGLTSCLSELGGVLLERGLGFCFGLLRALDATLDSVASSIERCVDSRHPLPDEEDEDDGKSEPTPDEVIRRG